MQGGHVIQPREDGSVGNAAADINLAQADDAIEGGQNYPVGQPPFSGGDTGAGGGKGGLEFLHPCLRDGAAGDQLAGAL